VAGGRGIGLSLVRTICERRGGWVSVRSGAERPATQPASAEPVGGADAPAAGAVFTAVLGRAATGPVAPVGEPGQVATG
jgi:signal transduction histidine kinase